MASTFTTMKGFDNIGDPGITEVLHSNIITFFDWGFLNKGGYINVDIPTSGAYGGAWHTLRPVETPYFDSGRVWEAKRDNWVWETEDLSGPNALSGVFVGDTFHANGSNHYIDVVQGRVVFDTAIAVTSEVKIEYAHKWINVIPSRDVPFLRTAQTNSFRVDDPFFSVGSGDSTDLARTRVNLPAVAIEMVTDKSREGYEIGSASAYSDTDVIFHVIAEDDGTANRIADAIQSQDEKTIFLYSPKRMAQNNAFPLDFRGAVASGQLTYPTLVAPTGEGGFRYTDGVNNGKMRFKDSRTVHGSWITQDVYTTNVRMTTEVILL